MKGTVLVFCLCCAKCSTAETKEALQHNVDAMHTVYSTAEMKEALCEGNAGGSDQMGSNDELEEVKCNDVVSTKRTVNT